MIDHTTFAVSNLEHSKDFYTQSLAPLGIVLLMNVTADRTGGRAFAGFGANGKPFFWIGDGAQPVTGVHIAFRAPSRTAVDAFYANALAAGGKDNGPPGLRPYYHPNYYGAFVLDPDGNNIEAVCHTDQNED
jgi:catechol 2,3-dioxygenase-like lactoylglutathione lyase family enzyme